MYSNKKEFKAYIRDKNICVIGIGISNTPLIEFLVAHGAKVTACDQKTKAQLGKTADKLLGLGVSLNLGSGYMDHLQGDMIFKTPGMRFDHPALLKAQEKGILITSEMEVFFDICHAKIIAVTGSDGKTTTTTLIDTLLREQGFQCHLGGNIGTPMLYRIDEISPEDYVVLEMSSFQLHTMKKSPQIAVITNITPNHLDIHKSYQEYIDAKKNIMLYQNSDDLVILNADNAVTASFIPEAKGKCRTFSSKTNADFCLDGGYITTGGRKVLSANDIKVPGKHNIENFMAAIGATYGLVQNEIILKVAKKFGGVPHRIELVRTLNGVRYYNSSIDSSPNRTINTLKVFEDPVILIAGGKDKGIAYDEIGAPILAHAKALLLIGATAPLIKKAVEEAMAKSQTAVNLPIYEPDSYQEAVSIAHKLAASGDVVLLSNASTSFDMFGNFEERGNLFKELVHKL